MKQRSIITTWISVPLVLLVMLNWGTSAVAQTTNVVTLTSFEMEIFDPPTPGSRPAYTYPYKYEWGADAPFSYWHNFNTYYTHPEDYNLTNYMGLFTFDNTGYGEFITNAPAGSGYGFGFGGGLNWTNGDDGSVYVSTNLSDYILSFDAKVEGLKPEFTTVGGEFQMRLDAPDDTIQPPDSNVDKDTLIQVNLNFNASSNWQHFVYTLDQGSIANGKTDLDFVLYRLLINEPRFGVNYHMPHDRFDYDGDNAVYLDNIQLQVVRSLPPPPPPPKVAFTVFDYNWDDKPIWYAWSGGQGWSSGVKATYYVTNDAAGEGVGGSNAYIMAMDNSALAGIALTYAGGNTGGGGPADYSRLQSPILADYRVLLDGRVVGLNPEKMTTSGTLQLHLIAPDDTLQPPDVDTANDFIIRLDSSIPNLQTNWQTIQLALNKFSVGSGTLANFTNYFNKISEIQFQVQINNAHSEADWGFDADNMIVIDNFKLERLQIGAPPLQIEMVADNNLRLSWDSVTTGSLKLQSATDPAGPYTDVQGAVSPYTVPSSGGPKYFRTVWVEPSN